MQAGHAIPGVVYLGRDPKINRVVAIKTLALSSNPMLIELTKAERWDGKLPTTVLPNGTLPFIDASK